MKVLLTAINAKYIHSNPAVYSLRAYAMQKLAMKNTVHINDEQLRDDRREIAMNQRQTREQKCDADLLQMDGQKFAANQPRIDIYESAIDKPQIDIHDFATNQSQIDIRDFAANQPHIDIREFTINQPQDDILGEIFKEKPDVLCISCYIWNRKTVWDLLPDLHQILPECKIYLGGPEVSYHTEQIFREFPFLQGIMAGEGEETFYRLVLELLTEESLCQVQTSTGAYRQNPETVGELSQCEENFPGISAWVRNVENVPTSGTILSSEASVNMDELPFFYEEWNADKDLGPFKNRILYYESSRGCPYACSYCLSSLDKKMRFRSLPLVFRELRFFLNRKVKQVKFIDRTFNCDRNRAIAIWNFIRENDNGVTNFHFEIAAVLIDDEASELLRSMRKGLVQLEIGVQSTHEKTLEAVRRKTDLVRLARVVTELRSVDTIHLHLDLIAGLPFEDLHRFRQSFNELYALDPHDLQLGFLKVLPGTFMETCCEEYAIRFRQRAPYEVLVTRWISYEELLELKKVERMLELYHNSGQFRKTLKACIGLFPDPYSFFLALAEEYEAKDLALITPSRADRYKALYVFLSERFPGQREKMQELLREDFMERELSSRRLPEFLRQG